MTKKEKLDSFIKKLEQDENVLSVVVFGSYARGNDQPESDIDLVVVLKDGYKRVAEYFEDQAFESIYTTEKSAVEYWNNHKHDAVGLWSVAKILYDRDGTGDRLKEYGEDLLNKKPDALDYEKIDHLRFDANDLVRAAETIYKSDPATASLLIHAKAADLVDTYFDTQQMWHPAPKQQLEAIKEIDEELEVILRNFYTVLGFEQKITILKNIVNKILGEKSSDVVQ